MTPRPAFTGSILERLDHERDHPDMLADRLADPRARLLRLDGLAPVWDESGALGWGDVAEAPAGVDLALLGLVGGAPRFVALTASQPEPAGGHRHMFPTLAALPDGEAALYAAARSLVLWHASHAFCPRCGSSTAVYRAGWARRCAGCGAEHFPRTDPVVIMLAEYRGRVLLGRQARFPPGSFSALAGFVEVGESIEEAVARELFEEAGVKTTGVRYLCSQPWPFPSQLMIACVATVESDALTLDTNELEAAIWVDRETALAALAGSPDAGFVAPMGMAIANTLLTRWAAGD